MGGSGRLDRGRRGGCRERERKGEGGRERKAGRGEADEK